jgi:hypothetical protein
MASPSLPRTCPGERYGRWLVVAPAKPTVQRSGGKTNRRWLCRCSCGVERDVPELLLRDGRSKSCGCWAREVSKVTNSVHGHCRNGRSSSEYQSWRAMRKCSDPTHGSYSNYGGRGIKVCAQWENFAQFLKDMGAKPEGCAYSIERRDVNGDYQPSNCHWVIAKDQQNNRRNNRLVEFGGETLTVAQWARKTGIDRRTLRSRLEKGWTAEAALTVPVRKTPGH